MKMCVPFSTKFVHVTWNCAPFCYRLLPGPRPVFFPVGPNSHPAVLWLRTNLSTKSCGSPWIHLEAMHLFARGHSHCHAPFEPNDMNTNTCLHIDTLDLHAKFQSPGAKTVAAKKWGIFGDQLSDRPTDQQTDRATYRAAGQLINN